MTWSIAKLYSKTISYLHPTLMSRTSSLIPFTHFCLRLCSMWIIHGLLGITVAYYSFQQDVLLCPANVPSLSMCPAHVWYFFGRPLWIKTLWTAKDLSKSWKHLVQLPSGALAQGNTKARKVKASGCCMISYIFGEQIQRKPEGFSQVFFYIDVNKYQKCR